MEKTIQHEANRKLTKAGALTIPAELRRRYGLKGKTEVRILTDHLGRIIIDPRQLVCATCRVNVTEYKTHLGVPICKECVKEIKEAFPNVRKRNPKKPTLK